MGYFWGRGWNHYGSTHVAEHLLFSVVPSILTFNLWGGIIPINGYNGRIARIEAGVSFQA